VLFCDLRGFTSFASTVEADVVMDVLKEFHTTVGELVRSFQATVGFFAGDGLMVFFNDPLPRPDPGADAARMAVELRDGATTLASDWARRGYALGLGIGVDVGEATLGQMGFEGRFDYSAIGNVVNMAARLCGEAESGQILVSARLLESVASIVEAEAVGDVALKGYAQPVPVWNIKALRQAP
jgi:class 3 adenylate cyclase